MKKWMIRLILGLVIFVAAALSINRYMATQQGGEITVVNQPSYPVMEITSKDGDYNLMPAYQSEVDLALVRNQITGVNSNGELGIKLYCYDYDITAIQYTLFENSDTKKQIEEGTLNQLAKQEEDTVVSGVIKFQHNLGQNQEYYLQLSVRLDKDTKTYFYTKIRNATELHLNEYLKFAQTFHEEVFERKNMEENASYLEPNASATDKSLDNVTISSSINSVFYGNMSLTKQSEPKIKVKELNKTYAVLELSSVVSDSSQKDVIQYYNMTEIIKMRYTTSRMYLLDYRRKMGAVYNGELIDSENNYLGIGIQNEENVSFKSAAKGHKISFVDEGQLWYYDYDKSKSSKIYSIKTENLSDPHNDAGGTEIKILSMANNGEITYLIYGYMNRGSYEGKNGMAVMVYHPEENYSEEVAFLETSVPYEMMKKDLDTCAYLNKENVFYCLLNGDFHAVSLTDKTDKILADNIMDEALTVSEDGSIIALEKERDLSNNRQIDLMNLKTGKTIEIKSDVDERIRSVGFILQDFIYAVAKADNIMTRNSGETLFPANTLQIVNKKGEKLKEITRSGKYISKTLIRGSVLEMQTASIVEGRFRTNTKKEYVRYKKSVEAKGVALNYLYDSNYWNQLYFSFPEEIYVKVKPKLADTTLKAIQDKTTTPLKASKDNSLERYFVYARGELLEDYKTLSEAVKNADKERGNVIDAQEKILWQCAYAEYAKVPNMKDVEKASSEKGSLRACLRMITKLTGEDADAKIATTEDKSPENLLSVCTGKPVMNLSGTSLEAALYYVDMGAPVLTKISRLRFVVIMSYNKDKVRYLDPITGKSTVVEREKIKEKLQEQGNVFYSYLN